MENSKVACRSLMVRVEMGGRERGHAARHAAAASTPGASARRGAAYRMLCTTARHCTHWHDHTPALAFACLASLATLGARARSSPRTLRSTTRSRRHRRVPHSAITRNSFLSSA
ncbi:unnamed protein product [Arctia plantaginis]|uniref:Uncharacterized protein n=1 Tax=Arctia plantaginis TaxID=874455 RepID=A0A8S1AF33_ARCPL|nr:unnamed protein product [Arctia plantaginis]